MGPPLGADPLASADASDGEPPARREGPKP